MLLIAGILLGVVLGFLLGRWSRRTNPHEFAAVTAQAIAANSDQFMQQAAAQVQPLVADAQNTVGAAQKEIAGLVEPLQERLDSLNREHRHDQGAVTEQLKALAVSHRDLMLETGQLNRALRSRGEQRGSWGEMQLRRVVELAGMIEHCDFAEQAALGMNGGRPDLTIQLPNERQIAVDAKTPLKAYLEALDGESEEARKQAAFLVAKQVRDRALELSQKGYQSQLPRSTDFVVMFLPGEFLLPVATRENPHLLDELVRKNVLIATPLTLIALLRAVAVGWREAKIAEDAQAIADLGADFHTKAATYLGHVADQGRNLERAIKSYNSGVASLTGRGGLVGLAEKLEDKGVAARKALPDGLQPSEIETRLP